MRPRLTLDEDCGNAPRKRVLADFELAWASGDREAVSAATHEELEWSAGEGTEGGLAELLETPRGPDGNPVSVLRLESIITHGALAAVDGYVEVEKGTRSRFCNVYRFGGHGKTAKIIRITSYR